MKLRIHSIVASFLISYFLPIPASAAVKYLVTGLSGPAAENAHTALAGCLNRVSEPSPDQIRACYETGAAHIQKALEPFGWFSARVKPRGLVHVLHMWIARYSVHTGPATRIETISIHIEGTGRNDPVLRQLVADFGIQKGDRFDTPALEKAQEKLLADARAQGWTEAAFTAREIQVSRKNHSATIRMTLQTGERFYFGPVTFGSSPFDPAFLQRFVQFQEDEPFSSEKLLKLQEDLSKSGYFREVSVIPDTAHTKNHRIPVNVTLAPAAKRRWWMGIGYGTFTGPRTTFGIDLRRIGNLGQHLSLQTRYSSVLKGLSAKYFIPGKNPLTDQYILGAEIQKFISDNGQSFSENGFVSRVLSIGEWQHTLSLHFLNERFQVDADPSQSGRVFYPDYAMNWIRADNPLDPSKAISIHLGLRGASEHILSFTNFVQGETKSTQIFTLGDSHRFVLRQSLGYTVVNDLTRLPLSLRYLAGGMGTVRGYEYGSIGPGRYLETASIEYQHHLYGDFSGAVFYDVGTATDHFNDNLMRGAGVGIIWHSMIGPIRIYGAFALSKPGHPFSLEFSLGPDF